MPSHLDDEQLSAHLDGDALQGPALAHLDGCPTCNARLTAMRAVVEALSQPPAEPDARRREAHLTAAMAAATATADAGTRMPGSAGMARLPTSRRRPRAISWLGAAAALTLVVGVGALGLTWRADRAHRTSSLQAQAASKSPTTLSRTAPTPAPSANASRAGATPFIAGADLGPMSDFGALSATLRNQLAVEDQLKRSAAVAAPPAGTATDSPATPASSCLKQAVADATAHGAGTTGPRYRARLSWQERPAVVWVLARTPASSPGGQPSYQVELMALSDCAALGSGTI
jgi:hypothetical protein